jgi:hypothetical protein
MSDDARIKDKELAASLLGISVSELYYLDETDPRQLSAVEPTETEDVVPEIELAAAEARGAVVPNRISYGVYLRAAGFDGTRTLYTWLGPDCARTGWYILWSDRINRWERAGWCRRPQTDAYDIRWKIYWRA